MTQLVPSCILSVTSFTSPAAAFPALARLERKLLPSQTFFTSSLPLQSLHCCGQSQDNNKWWKWPGRSVPHSAVQKDAAVLDMAHSSRHRIYVLWTEHAGNREMPRSVADTVHVTAVCHTPLHTWKYEFSLLSLRLERVHLILWNSWQNMGKVFYMPLTAFSSTRYHSFKWFSCTSSLFLYKKEKQDLLGFLRKIFVN